MKTICMNDLMGKIYVHMIEYFLFFHVLKMNRYGLVGFTLHSILYIYLNLKTYMKSIYHGQEFLNTVE